MIRTLAPAVAGVPRGRLALSVLLGVGAVGVAVGLLATSGYLISKAALQPPILSLTVAIVAVRFFGVTRAVLRYLERLVSHDVAFRHLARLRVSFFERLVRAGSHRNRSGDLLSRFVADVDSLQHLFLRALAPPLVAIGVVGIAVTAAWLLLPAAALILAAGLLLALVVLPWTAVLGSRASGRRQAPARAELTAELVELLQGAPELVVYGREEAQAARVGEADARLARLSRRDAVVAGATSGLGMLLTGGTMAAVLAVSAPAVANGTLGGVYLAVLAFLALAAFEAITPLPLAAQHLSSAAGAASRLEELDADERPIEDPAHPRPLEGPCVLELEGARLRYSADGPWTLDGVDLSLEPGRRVALVGPSGSGKTTIAHALVRFRDLDEGRATLDGNDLSEYAQVDLRRAVVLGAQDAYLFATSIRENVRLAKPSADDAELAHALRRAGAWDWVGSLPDGLDTHVGENGAQVSGGQRQRIALARVLLADARILILDEPTAHLDPESAAAFVDDLLAATEEIGLLLITHRLEGLDRFDEIVVLEQGRVVERGTEAELVASRGRYARLATR